MENKDSKGWWQGLLIIIGLLVIGGIVGHFLFPKEVEVETPKEFQVGVHKFSTLDILLDESKGEVTISGLSVGNLWLGRVDGISMFPTMKDGSAVIIEELCGGDIIKVGDIIVFNSTMGPEYIAHRVSSTGYDDYGWYAETLADNKYTSLGSAPYRVRLGEVWGKVRVYLDY